MTKYDKINFLHFITLIGMYINPVDDRNVASFIHGYELGTKHKCDFTQLLKQLLIDKYKIKYSSDGWIGQVRRLANKLSLSWVATFKKVALEVIADERNGGLDKAMIEIQNKRITSLILRINVLGDPWFDERWKEEWLSLCAVKSKWFKQLWTDTEWVIVKAIDEQVQADNIFSTNGSHLPTLQLLQLKDQYDKTTKKNGI